MAPAKKIFWEVVDTEGRGGGGGEANAPHKFFSNVCLVFRGREN